MSIICYFEEHFKRLSFCGSFSSHVLCRGMNISRANDANRHDETLVLNFTHELLESFIF